MAEGFKLLDAYVEVKANATGIGDKVSKAFAGEIAPAAKKMADAVETATQRVAASSKRQADAASSLNLAQMRLADVEKTAAPGSTQLAAAQEGVARALRNVASSSEGAQRAQRNLEGAQSRLKESGSGAGTSYLSGLKGALTAGAVGGIVGGLASSVASGVVGIIGSAVSDIGGMLTTVGTDVARTVIDFNSQLESANIGFTTMLGSGTKAKAFLGDLQTFAKATPFDFGGLVHSAQNMMGMGISAKNVIPDLTALGDAVASVGGSAGQVDQVTAAFSQMNAKGTVDLGNMYQVINGGVSHALDYMAAGLHTTTGKLIGMISAGKVASSTALPALIKGIEHGTGSIRGLGGMMDKQSRTFSGALSNIQDAFTQTTAKAFKPFFDAASHGMQRFATALTGKPVEKFTKDVEKTIKPFAKQIDKWLSGIDFNKIFTEASKALKSLTKGLDPKDFGKFLKDMTKDAGDIFKDIIRIAPKVIKMFKEIAPAVMDTIKGFVDFAGGIADVIDWFVKTEAAYDKWRAGFDKGMKGFLKDSDGFWRSIGDGWDGFWGDIGRTIAHGWDTIVGRFKLGGQQILDFFGGIPGALGTIGGQMVDGLVSGVRGAWSRITGVIHDLAMKLPEPIRKALGIASPSKVFHLIGTQIGQGMHLGMASTVPAIRAQAARLVAAATAERTTGGKGAAGRAATKRHNTAITATIAGLRQDAKDLSSLSTVFHKAAADVSRGIHRGLLGSADQIQQTAQGLIDAVRLDSRFFGKARAGRMVSAIKSGYRDLKSLTGRRDVAMANVANDKTNLADLYTQRSDYAAAVKSNVMGNAGVSAMFTDLRGADPVTIGAATASLNGNTYTPTWTTTKPKVTAHAALLDVKKSLKKLLADTKKFSANMTKLAKLGIDPYTYDEIVQAGVRGGGLETSDALIKDPTLAKSIFKIERQVASAGAGLGTKTASHVYAGRIEDAKDQLRHDQAQVSSINVTMVVEAKKIDEVQKLITMVSHVKATARKKKGKH